MCRCVPVALNRSGGVAGFAVLVIAGAFTFAIFGPAISWCDSRTRPDFFTPITNTKHGRLDQGSNTDNSHIQSMPNDASQD